MICKKCGFEYVDGLPECPNCQTPNEPSEAQVLTNHDRDSFEGVTIDENGNAQEGMHAENRDDYSQNENPRTTKIKFQTLGGSGLIWKIVGFIVLALFIFFVLPTLAFIFIIGAVLFYLYNMFFV